MSDIKEADFQKLEIGQSYTSVNIVTEENIIKFSEATGDINPVHLDEDYARNSMFGERIAHGMISAGYISAIFGTHFPGPGSIYLSQTLKFKAPVKIADTVETTVTITHLDQKRQRVTLNCSCSVGDVLVLKGEAQLMIPERAK